MKYFSSYILRTPTLPLQQYFELTHNYSTQKLLAIFAQPVVQQAIYAASPALFTELVKWQKQPTEQKPEKEKSLVLTLYKYLSRMSTRCTPFGYFAACSMGVVSEQTKIELPLLKNYKSFTQFDSQFWNTFLQHLAAQSSIKLQLLFYPNSSLYTVGNFYRYIEYSYNKTAREYKISAIRKTAILDLIMTEAKTGISLQNLISLLIDEPNEHEEAALFVDNLIENQFLVSNFLGTVSGDNGYEMVKNYLAASDITVNQKKKYYQLFDLLDNLVLQEKFSTQNQELIENLITELALPFEQKYLFQTDLFVKAKQNTINNQTLKKIKDALGFLAKLSPKKENENLAYFIKRFTERYETREMPLAFVMDSEIGLGYLNGSQNDSHPLLEPFYFKGKNEENKTENWTKNAFILEKKLQNAIANNLKEITLTEKDFDLKKETIGNLPSSFSVITEVYKKDNTETIAIESSGSISAAKLLGRFTMGSPEIEHFTQEIANKEQELNADKILAEIVHIPQDRTGNILKRKKLRDFEIPFLAHRTSENKIELEDLLVSIKHNKVVLQSKKHKKEVLPCLSNAHNYGGGSSLAIYQFLCDLQGQNTNPIYNFSWGVLENHYTYFPRVLYKDVILAKAKWKITVTEFLAQIKNKTEIDFEKFEAWKKANQLVRYVNLVEFDNTILLDLEQKISVDVLIDASKNKTSLVLEEFIFTENEWVKQGENSFTNQFIFSFYKD